MIARGGSSKKSSQHCLVALCCFSHFDSLSISVRFISIVWNTWHSDSVMFYIGSLKSGPEVLCSYVVD